MAKKSETMVIGPEDVGTLPPPPPKEPTPSALRNGSSTPREVMLVWGPYTDGDQPRECVPTSVVVSWQGADRNIASEAHYRRGDGTLLKAPAGDLAAAGKKLAAAKTLEEVVVVLTDLLAAGVK